MNSLKAILNISLCTVLILWGHSIIWTARAQDIHVDWVSFEDLKFILLNAYEKDSRSSVRPLLLKREDAGHEDKEQNRNEYIAFARYIGLEGETIDAFHKAIYGLNHPLSVDGLVDEDWDRLGQVLLSMNDLSFENEQGERVVFSPIHDILAKEYVEFNVDWFRRHISLVFPHLESSYLVHVDEDDQHVFHPMDVTYGHNIHFEGRNIVEKRMIFENLGRLPARLTGDDEDVRSGLFNVEPLVLNIGGFDRGALAVTYNGDTKDISEDELEIFHYNHRRNGNRKS